MPICLYAKWLYAEKMPKKSKVEKGYMMSKQISALIIEDEENIRNILEYNLKSDGFEVILAEDGPTGLELAREKKPDVILLDWMMPEMDGLEVLSELKKDTQTKNIPAFMLTVENTSCDIGQAIIEGAEGYFTKPFDQTKLGQTLKSRLKKIVKG